MSGKNRRKRYAMEKPKQRNRKASAAWSTGYTDSARQNAAIQNGAGKGSQKCKRDKLKHQIRTYTDPAGERADRYESHDRPQGSFLEPNESKSYIQPGGYARAKNHPARVANELQEHGDSRIIPTPEKTRAVNRIK